MIWLTLLGCAMKGELNMFLYSSVGFGRLVVCPRIGGHLTYLGAARFDGSDLGRLLGCERLRVLRMSGGGLSFGAR
jgi:hypothetical protein